MSAFNDRLITSSNDGKLRLYDINTQTCLKEWEAHSFGINCVIWDQCGDAMISAGDDGLIKLWDYDGEHIHTLMGHTDYV